MCLSPFLCLRVGQPHVSKALKGFDSVKAQPCFCKVVGLDRVDAELALRGRLIQLVRPLLLVEDFGADSGRCALHLLRL